MGKVPDAKHLKNTKKAFLYERFTCKNLHKFNFQQGIIFQTKSHGTSLPLRLRHRLPNMERPSFFIKQLVYYIGREDLCYFIIDEF